MVRNGSKCWTKSQDDKKNLFAKLKKKEDKSKHAVQI